MSFFNRIRPDPGFASLVRSDPDFVSPVRSDPGFVSPIRSDPVRSDPGFVNGLKPDTVGAAYSDWLPPIKSTFSPVNLTFQEFYAIFKIMPYSKSRFFPSTKVHKLT